MGRPRLTLTNDREPWEQQPRETSKQYARFAFYRDLGRHRNYAQLRKFLEAAGDGAKYDTLIQTSWEFRWIERAAAWDLAQDQADRDQLIIERRDMVKRHRSIAGALLGVAIKALRDISIKQMAPADVARYVKLATDIERIAIGEPQSTVAITGPAGGPIQTEDITHLSPEERRIRLAEIATELARRAGTDTDDDE